MKIKLFAAFYGLACMERSHTGNARTLLQSSRRSGQQNHGFTQGRKQTSSTARCDLHEEWRGKQLTNNGGEYLSNA